MQNAWAALYSEDMIRTMHLCRCDGKYIDGCASDFECFEEWIALLSQLEGNDSAERFAERLSCILGEKADVSELAACDPKQLWRRCNTALWGVEYSADLCDEKEYYHSRRSRKQHCVEKFQNLDEYSDVSSAVSAAVRAGCLTLDKMVDFVDNYTKRRILFVCDGKKFARPDRYRAQRGIELIGTDEKEYFDVLRCQLICELCYLTERGKVQLVIDPLGNIDYALDMVKYFTARDLSVDIFMISRPSDAPTDIVRVCLEGGENCAVTPLVCADASECEHFVTSLARVYPRGMISFVKKCASCV